jgi:hypothetical protein
MNKEEAKKEILNRLKERLRVIDENRDQAVFRIVKERDEVELKKIQAELKNYE